MTLKIHHAQAKRAEKLGIALTVIDQPEGDVVTHVAQATVNGNTYSAATVKEALEQAILSLTAGGNGADHERRSVDKRVAAEMERAAKPKKAKKAAKKKARKRAEEGDGEEDAEGGDGASVVKRKYRKLYAPQENTCGDAMAQALSEAVRDEESGKIDVKTLARIAKANGVDLSRWAGKNVGMQRMNLGNVLRGILRNGTAIDIDGQRFKPEPK